VKSLRTAARVVVISFTFLLELGSHLLVDLLLDDSIDIVTV
jgi:hypothetical protein